MEEKGMKIKETIKKYNIMDNKYIFYNNIHSIPKTNTNTINMYINSRNNVITTNK